MSLIVGIDLGTTNSLIGVMEAGFPILLADSEGTVAKAFGVPFNNGFAKRESFLIKDGKIAWTMPKASTTGHAQDVLKAYEGLAAAK